MADYSKNLEKLDSLIEIFPNSNLIFVALDSEEDGNLNFDIDTQHVGSFNNEDAPDRGLFVSVVYKGKTFMFADQAKFFKSINK